MITIGLTGSIGMGKSTVAATFAELGAAVWSADEAVHRLYAPGGKASAALAEGFPAAIDEDGVDRAKLSALVMNSPEKLMRLETIVHPLVAADRESFLEDAGRRGAELAVLDIPLLFESGYEPMFDATIVVTAPADVQRARVLDRAEMTAEKFETLLARQMSDAEKRACADYIIVTDRPVEETRAEVARVLAAIRSRFKAE